MTRRLVIIAVSCALGALVACAPKPKRVPMAERACREAALAESSVTANQQRVDLLLSEIGEKEARLVQLQRLRSRIVTGKITDQELVQIELEPRRQPEPVAQDTAHAGPPLEQTAPVDTAQAHVPTVEQPASTPSDTMQSAVPTGSAIEQGPSTATQQAEPKTDQQPAPEEKQETPSQGTEEEQVPQGQTEKTTPSESSGEATTSPAPESAP